MKKIDFHIHTIATAVDAHFEFDLAKLIEYVDVMQLDGIAVTNHNIFDRTQFETIANSLEITVLPGIEINLGKGHALLISDAHHLDDFAAKCAKVDELVKIASDSISVSKLKDIFGDLTKYLIVPHYDKRPPLDQSSLDELGDHFIAGEVMSAKKFIYALKNTESPAPLLFSDARAKADWEFKTRQTYLDISTIDIRSIRICLSDKTKLSLSSKEGSELIQVTPDGINISSGLTVVLGGRSSGKSHTLDEISEYNENIKYIKQFDLIEKNPEKEAELFNDRMGKRQQEYGDRYLKRFRDIVDEVRNISLKTDEKKLEDYIGSLLKYAEDVGREDSYSKTAMFSESNFPVECSDKLKDLINATLALLRPGKYASIIDANINHNDLVNLLLNLIHEYRAETLARKKREWTNNVVNSIKHSLGSLSAKSPIKDANLLEGARNRAKVLKFVQITKELQKPRTIVTNQVGRFSIEERSVPIQGARELKEISGKVASFMDAFECYDRPYEFLMKIALIENVDPATYYKFFTKIEYNILNEYGVHVSGGERAEFKLINEIDGGANYDIILIDEPESSFDNVFLSSDVNKTIKEISIHTPVVVVTHNNTVGASIKPNYLIHTERKIIEGSPEYRVYTGRATDKELVCAQGESINNSEITLKYLEAGKELYSERSKMYETLEN